MAEMIADDPPIGVTLLGRPIPRGWQQQRNGPCGFAYVAPNGLKVIETDGGAERHGEWLHVSASFEDRLPSWEDMHMVKRLFVGLDRTAIMVLPPVSKYVNIHPYCLHLWHRLDGETAPDFAGEVAPGRYSI